MKGLMNGQMVREEDKRVEGKKQREIKRQKNGWMEKWSKRKRGIY